MSHQRSEADRPPVLPIERWRYLALGLAALLFLYYLLPLSALLFSGPPAAVLESLQQGYVLRAASTSLIAAGLSTAIAATFGLPLAYWLSRTDHRAKPVVLTVVIMPLVLPPIVSGMLLLKLVGPAGIGGLLGDPFTGSLPGVVLAQTFVASPFLVVTAKAAFDGVDEDLEAAARSLGASRLRSIRRVTLPLAKGGIAAGLVLTFARAMGEFGATLTLSYYPRTLPVQIWVSYVTDGLDAAFPVAVVLLGVAVGTLVAVWLLRGNPWR